MIVSFSGQLGNGKTIAAKYLAKKLNWKVVSFAAAVKKIFAESFEVDSDFIEKWKRESEPPPNFNMNVRKSLQFIGDGFRQIQNDIWIKIASRYAGDFTIDDARYLNESRAVKAKNGINVLIFRPGFLNDDPNPSESQIRPLIEWCISNRVDGQIFYPPQDLQNYDYFLINDGNLDDLYYKIDNKLIPFLKDKYEF